MSSVRYGRPPNLLTDYVGAITLALLAVCIVVVFFGKAIAADVLVLPVATVFAFTQLRGTLPGAPPGFGT